jgi:hypothetical protein
MEVAHTEADAHNCARANDVPGILHRLDQLDCETEAAARHELLGRELRADPPSRREGRVRSARTDAERVSEAREKLKSHSWEERYAATLGLGRFGGSQTSAVVELLRCLRDEHALVRAAAATSLAVLHQARERGGPMLRLSVQGLVVALDDAEVWVRLAARRALIACIIVATR